MRQLLIALCCCGFAFGLPACGGNGVPAPGLDASSIFKSDAGVGDDPTACKGTCTCPADVNCACASGSDCTVDCAIGDLNPKCNVACSGTSKCDVDAQDNLKLACSNTAQCTGAGRDGSDLGCSNDAKCDVSVMAGSNVTCSNQASCKVKVGLSTHVVCSGSATCELSGTANDEYTVVCSDSARCACRGNCNMTCGTTGLATTCGDGSKVCGKACP
ncbi:MAG: hypothetical protein QM765_30080 [Myxococcales bacterium]